ncbi:hypothetical protein [Streptomyces sp. NPDC058683]|uniref:hypothetical protein n=1 Tax=Streptomyces sp. NPDC058683 TaxID=3346597 RepID=UPI0036570080
MVHIEAPAVLAGRAGLRTRPAGDALLVHRKGGLDPAALAFAGTLAPDPLHQLVVVDLPFDATAREWEAVPRALTAMPDGIRMVFSHALPPDVRRFGQAAAERLGGVVLAPDGAVRTLPEGGLFVAPEDGTGWLSYRPRHPVGYDSRRFPKPAWEYAVTDRAWHTASHAVVEPTPSGVWLRGTGAPGGGRHWLVDRIPAGTEMLTAVVGSPGGPPVDLPDAVRVWHSVLPSARRRLRFLQLGPVALPDGVDSLGQGLADGTGEQVVFYTGLPARQHLGGQTPDIEVPSHDGTAAWRPFVSEVVYFPGNGRTPPLPALFGVRSPLTGVPDTTGGTYAYGPETVLEVVQSGLWLRPPAEPDNSDRVRRVAAAPGRALLLYDRATPESGERLRGLAEDMLRQLDPTLREAFRVTPADEPGPSLGWHEQEWWVWSPAHGDTERDTVASPAADPTAPQATPPTSPSYARIQPAPAPAPPTYPTTAAAPAPTTLPYLAATTPPEAPAEGGLGAERGQAVPAGAERVGTVSVPTRPRRADPGDPDGAGPAPVVPTGPANSAQGPTVPADPASTAPSSAAPGDQAGAEPAPAGTTDPARAVPTERGNAERTPADPVNTRPMPATSADPLNAHPTPTAPADPINTHPAPTAPAAPVNPPPASAASADLTSPAPVPPPGVRAGAPLIRLESDEMPSGPSPAGAGREPAGAAPAEVGERGAAGGRTDGVRGVRVQPVPGAAVTAVPPERGLERERAWLRKTFHAQFGALAGSVARVLSESPGLRSSSREDAADAMTDLVAVRLYLGGDSARVDAAVRGATTGPHVPMARCVTAGLRRLPSYRGPALLHAPAGPAELAWFHEGRVSTEWAFCAASTVPYPAPPGSVDFLVWSMTARRTRLVDPAFTDRVVFEPGTRFKVLRTDADGDRPAVLLRQLSDSEAGPDGQAPDGQAPDGQLPLDEIALNGLTASLATLREFRGGPQRGPEPPARPVGVPPGLLPARPASSNKGARP